MNKTQSLTLTPPLNKGEGDPNRQWKWRVITSIEMSQVPEVLRLKVIGPPRVKGEEEKNTLGIYQKRDVKFKECFSAT